MALQECRVLAFGREEGGWLEMANLVVSLGPGPEVF
jgi:hypothetical protein